VVAVGRSGRVVLEFSHRGDPFTFPGTPVFTVVGLEVDITATLATSARVGADDDQVVIEWGDDAFEGMGGQLSRMALDADDGTSITPIFAGGFRVLAEGFPGQPTGGVYEVTLGEATVSVDVTLSGPAGQDGVGIDVQGELPDVGDLPAEGEPGDAWLIDGDLWLWAAADEEWINAGPVGIPGPEGDPGTAATIAVGTVTTVDPDDPATVTNSGTSAAAVFDFEIPKGDQGDQGDPGDAATIAVGTVDTVGPSDPATVTNSGTSAAAVFDFEIPKGDQGDQGDPGPAAFPYDVNTVAASGATETLPATFQAHKVTMDQACEFSFDNPAQAGHTFLLLLSGSFGVTFPASVDWEGGVVPTYATPSLFGFTTLNGGTQWIGSLISRGVA
jgi:hypothetical protein